MPGWFEVEALASLLRFRPESSEQIAGFQGRLLRRLVRHAYLNVSFYRDRFEAAGIHPGDIRSVEDIGKIPVTSRIDFRKANPDSLLSPRVPPSGLIRSRTTGSTGMPMEITKSRGEERIFHLIRLQSMWAAGYRPQMKVLRIGVERNRPFLWKAIVPFGLFRQNLIPLTTSPVKIAAKIRELRPDVVIGLPTILACVAEEILRKAPPHDFRFAVSGGELLTAGLKRRIESAFGRVVDFYASIEAQHPIAIQCRKGPFMHVNDQGVIVEILGDDNHPVAEGQCGEVVLTSLFSYAMPIIRYRMGDLAVAGPKRGCPHCSHRGNVIVSLAGRRSDYFRLSDGNDVLAIEAAHFLQRAAPWVLQYELVQEAPERIRLSVVPLHPPSEEEAEVLRSGVEKCFKELATVHLLLVEKLDPGPGGKFRIIRTNLGSPYDTAG